MNSKGSGDDTKGSGGFMGGSSGAPCHAQGLVLVPTPDLVHQVNSIILRR